MMTAEVVIAEVSGAIDKAPPEQIHGSYHHLSRAPSNPSSLLLVVIPVRNLAFPRLILVVKQMID